MRESYAWGAEYCFSVTGVNYYTRELMNPGDNPPVGIVLCAEKNDAVVRYTLPEDEKQVFAAQYMTYLPTQEELQTLLQEV